VETILISGKRLPRTLAGKGEVDMIVPVDGETAITVKVNSK